LFRILLFLSILVCATGAARKGAAAAAASSSEEKPFFGFKREMSLLCGLPQVDVVINEHDKLKS
jgi:hypothetical protein